MSKFSRSSNRGKTPKIHAHEQRHNGSKQILSCSLCHCYFYKKAWHHPVLPTRLGFQISDLKSRGVVCPACQMVQAKQYAGRILIEDIPGRMLNELSNLIYSYGRKSFKRDSQDRLVSIKHYGQAVEVTTTDDRLAVRLAKKIQDVFSKVTLALSHSEEPYLTQLARLRFIG